ncbi:MAG: hypothetical protein QOJ35_3108 [Solirubrobacteraceae bacterium]|nr:hypothetical protein [Solirubrobacteraceae bacterium]
MVVAGLAALLAWIGIGGTHSARRTVGSNGTGSEEFIAVVGPRQQLCQAHEDVPQHAGSVRMTIGTYGLPGPPLRTTVRRGHEELLPAGRLAAGWRQGLVEVRLGAPAAQRLADVTVCVADLSRQRLAVAGAPLGPSLRARVGGRLARGRVRIEYVDGTPRSAWSLAGTTVSRMTFGRGLWGGLAPWLALALALLAAAAAVRALLGLAEARDGA